jgi:predicted small lipoprotein YifL
MRLFILTILALAVLTGCGRRGAPEPPGPASAVIYPHVYPAQ